MNNLEQPKIDVKKINKTANEAAEKAYLSAIDDYYNSYDSPYKKMINAELKKQKFGYPMELPDILSEINKGLSNEVDRIANEAVANTFIPMVSKVLLRTEKHQKLSEILKEIIYETFEEDETDSSDYDFSYEKVKPYDWLRCELKTPSHWYEFTLHTVYYSLKDGEKQKYQALSMPLYRKSEDKYNRKMKLIKDDIEIEMPFVANILQDKVLRIFCSMMLSKSEIDLDCSGFEDDMFPEKEY